MSVFLSTLMSISDVCELDCFARLSGPLKGLIGGGSGPLKGFSKDLRGLRGL